MDGVFAVLGVIALIIGVLLTTIAFMMVGATTADLIPGPALMSAGLGMMATAEIIEFLKEIRDRLPKVGKVPGAQD
jgi:membrane-bound ClpP family serine protease